MDELSLFEDDQHSELESNVDDNFIEGTSTAEVGACTLDSASERENLIQDACIKSPSWASFNDPFLSTNSSSLSTDSLESVQEYTDVHNADSPQTSEDDEIIHRDDAEKSACLTEKEYLLRGKRIISSRRHDIQKQKDRVLTETLKELETEKRELLLKTEELERHRDVLRRMLIEATSKK